VLEEPATVIVAYDVPADAEGDRRRTRLYQALLAFGRPVQYSLFECRLSGRELERLRTVLGQILVPRTDRVALYHLCRTCARRVERLPAGEPTAGLEMVRFV